MGVLRFVFWDVDTIRLVSGNSFGDVRGKVRLMGVQVPVEYRGNRRKYQEYFRSVTGRSVSLSRAVLPYGLFWFDKGFRSFTLSDGSVMRMVRVSACVGRSLNRDGDVLDDFATVNLFRSNRFELFENMSDSEVLFKVRGSVYAESMNNVFLIDSTVLPR